jgi:hypothetical protein
VVHGPALEDVTSQIAWVEIEAADGACYLFYFDANGNCLTDTWHETVERAKAQAQFEFETDEGDWKDVDADA